MAVDPISDLLTKKKNLSEDPRLNGDSSLRSRRQCKSTGEHEEDDIDQGRSILS